MDMLVKLYTLEESGFRSRLMALSDEGVSIRRAMSYEKHVVVSFVRDHFTAGYGGWPAECDVALSRVPGACLIAVHDRHMVGFACYDIAFKGFFGPTGVVEPFRGRGIGAALLLETLFAMRGEGYAYAIIGGAGGQVGFYERVVGASAIAGSDPGGYPPMLSELRP